MLPGQTVDFDIFDFTLKDSVGVSSAGTDPLCPVEATFMEHREPTTRQLCNGSLRQRYLYSSKSNLVVVYFTLNDQIANVPLFFLKYQGKEVDDLYANLFIKQNVAVAGVEIQNDPPHMSSPGLFSLILIFPLTDR